MASRRALEFFAETDIGRVREHNEDAVSISVEPSFAILADGMGGYNAGEVAAHMAIDLVSARLQAPHKRSLFAFLSGATSALETRVREAVEVANREILHLSRTESACEGMGTTVVLACCQDEHLLVAHVGDSRAYRMRDAQLEQLTHDHSVLQEYIDAGLIDPEDAAHSPLRHLVTRAVGTHDQVEVEVHSHTMRAGDVYLLCSDGLTDMLNHVEIQAILRTHSDLKACSAQLIAQANAAGGRDNISVVLMRVHALGRRTWLARWRAN